MKKKAVLLSILSFIALPSFAYELFLPKTKMSTVNSNYAFFVGKAGNGEYIMINNLRIYTASNGAFAHSVKLKNGENRIVIRSNYNTQIYKLCKKTAVTRALPEIQEFEEVKLCVVKKDNVPLRIEPSYSGERLSHLFRGTKLIITASQGDFYRVFLSKDTNGWIYNKDVDFECKNNDAPPEFLNMTSDKYKNASVRTISFTENLPYTIEDNEKDIVFKVYNPLLSESSVYSLNIQKPAKYTYAVSLKNGIYTIKVNELPKALSDCTIVIDAGHGGEEKGAIGPLGDKEKDINLKIALELQTILKDMGANVIMTRECDGNITLDDRARIAKDNNANIFVSIHLNSIGDIPMNIHKNRGTSIYYYNRNSKDLAGILERTISKSAGTRRDNVRTASFAVIRPTDYVGVLVEAAYMTNPLDSILYRNSDFAYNTAKGIADGILEYVLK